jgi:hypothetical protein
MDPRQAALLSQAEELITKLAAAPVLWKYIDSDSGKEFFLPSRMQNVHSPYTGKSVPQRPERFQISEVQKELRQVEKGPAGAPGPKSGAPRKKKHAAEDPAWKVNG